VSVRRIIVIEKLLLTKKLTMNNEKNKTTSRQIVLLLSFGLFLQMFTVTNAQWKTEQISNPSFDNSFSEMNTPLMINSAISSLAKQRKLLPNNLGIIESILWSENGVMRTTGIAPLTPENRKAELGWRRTMLTTHQIGGFVTLGSMIATVFYGQKVLDGKNDLRGVHETLAGITVASYMATGTLALLTPPPQIRRDEWNTVSTHKLFSWIHFSGMIATPLLADLAAERSNSQQENPIKSGLTSSEKKKLRFHQISAYITTAAFAAALITVTF